MKPIEPTQLYKLGSLGVVVDVKPHHLPPEAWSGVNNVVFSKDGVAICGGHAQIFGTMSVAPEFIFNAPALGASFWIYTSLTKAYVYEGGIHSDITRSSGGDYTATAGRLWNGTIIGGVPIINNGIDLPQYWPTLSAATRLANLTAFASPAGALRAKVVRAFGQYLVALNVTENGVPLPHTLIWSSKADPGTIPASWNYTDPTVEAGRTHLTDIHGGVIQDAGMLGDELIIYKEYSTHALRLSGGNDVMAPRLLLANAGLFAPRCFASFAEGTQHFVVTSDDIIVHAGTRQSKSIAEYRVRRAIFSEIDPTNYLNSFAFENRLTKECWFAYPTLGNTYPNKAARWNYRDDVWTFRDFTGVSTDFGTVTDASTDVWDSDTQVWDADVETWSTESRVQQIFVDRSKAHKLDVGYTFNGTAFTSFAERTGIAIDGKDRSGEIQASLTSRKLMSRVWPKITGAAVVKMQVGKQELLSGPVTWDVAQFFDPATQRFLDSNSTPVNGLLLAIRYEAASGQLWQLEGEDLYVVKVSGL